MDENKKEIIEDYLEKVGILKDKAVNELLDNEIFEIVDDENDEIEGCASSAISGISQVIEKVEEFLLENQK